MVVCAALASWTALPLLGQETKTAPTPPVQPLPFSHKMHIESASLTCEECHPGRDPGERMTLPAVAACMACHVSIAKDKPAIQKLAEYAKNKQPIPWVRIYVVASDIFWSHRPHLKAGLTCEMCHGKVSQMDVMARVTNVTTMEGCVDCHKAHQANTGCDFCHEDK